ncbi:MAG: T9SS C-terminal target domain-containing protein [Runella slithyformis]|nr:MAG: T9SS C-terminal target domain-containing protein [Runella slithyformis]
MSYKKYIYILPFYFAWLFVTNNLLAQVKITFPSNRMVFQRDNAGNGRIPITGQFSQAVDRVEARVVPVGGGQGQQTDWQTIQQSPQGGFFSGNITVRGGWYQLEIRGILNNNTVATDELTRVGVGEVFLIAGQSNAQGRSGYGSPGAGDDRVNCVDYLNSSNSTSELPQPNFAKLNENSSISPRGVTAWYWGRLGDLLVSRLNVPVLFYNASYDATTVKNWQQTMNGGSTNSVYGGGPLQNSMPYASLRLAIHYYAATTGLRAILWHQGEADNYGLTSTSSYVSDLQAVINKSRENFGRNIGWVVARVSYDNNRGVNNNVINGQNVVINSTGNVFAGPNTDVIQIPRPDGVHLQNNGLTETANAWNNSLDNNFFANCPPHTGSYPNIVASCGNNQINLSVQGNFQSVQWSNGANGNNVSFGPGSYRGTIRDGNGGVYFTPNINVSNDLQSAAANINVDGRLNLCEGNSVGLVSGNGSGNMWSNGSNNQRIDVTTAGNYTLTTRNSFGCSASSTVTVTTFQGAKPAAPVISASGPTTFCKGGEVTLNSSSAAEHRWTNGERGASIIARVTGTYGVRAISDQGCISDQANINVTVNIPPAAPTINANSATTFCEGGRVTLTSNYQNGNIWSNNDQNREIVVTQSGNYNVRFRDENGCDAISNNITVKVNAIPPKPNITAENPTTFCEGQNTTLVANSTAQSIQYNWNNNSRDRRITVGSNGSFAVSVTDANGCVSPTSDLVTVKVNPLPAPPIISINRTPNICENEVVTFTSNAQTGYSWSNGQSTQSVVLGLPGNYSVRAVDGNFCLSNPSNVIGLTVNTLPPKPIVTAQGPTTICQGDRVILRSNYGTGITWNTFEATQQITTFSSGEYRVKYRDGSGCESQPSDPVFVTVNALPAAPRIVNERPLSFCQNDSTILNIPLSAGIYNFSWSTGATGNRIVRKTAGDITATVTEFRTGCTSPSSEIAQVVVNPLPNQPTITPNGPTTFCADQNLTISASPASRYEWSNEANLQNITVNKEGNYSLRVRNQFGCLSVFSNSIAVRVNPLPAAPSVIAEGPLTFCDGGQVGLRVESLLETTWNTNESTKRIVATKSGNYAARLKDQNGCLSPFSVATRIEVKELPASPVIQKIGIYTLEAAGSMATANYAWLLNNQPYPSTNTPIIKANQTGLYQVLVSVKYGALECFSKPSASLNFIVETTNNGLGVYPNPSLDGKVTVETLENLKDATVLVYDYLGRPIYHKQVPLFDGRKQFDLSELPPATYYLRVVNDQYSRGKKLVLSPK